MSQARAFPAESRPKCPAIEFFQLPCPQRYGGCGGVYPLQVSLVDTLTGQPLDSFTTYLVVVPSSVAPTRAASFLVRPAGGASVALTAAGRPAVPPGPLALLDNDRALGDALAQGTTGPFDHSTDRRCWPLSEHEVLESCEHTRLPRPGHACGRSLQCRRSDPTDPGRSRDTTSQASSKLGTRSSPMRSTSVGSSRLYVATTPVWHARPLSPRR